MESAELVRERKVGAAETDCAGEQRCKVTDGAAEDNEPSGCNHSRGSCQEFQMPGMKVVTLAS